MCSEILGGYITTVLLFICILMRLPWSKFHQMSGPAVIRSSGCSHRNVAQNNKKEKEEGSYAIQDVETLLLEGLHRLPIIYQGQWFHLFQNKECMVYIKAIANTKK